MFQAVNVITQPAIRVDDALLVYLVRQLLEKPHTSWSKEDAGCVLSLLKNRNCFILGGCSEESVSQWLAFNREWEAYEDEHSGVEALFDSSSQKVDVDPPIVCFTFPVAGAPPGFAAAVAATDVNVGLLPVACSDGSASSTVFITRSTETAHYFAGRMRALFPTVFGHTMNARGPPFAW